METNAEYLEASGWLYDAYRGQWLDADGDSQLDKPPYGWYYELEAVALQRARDEVANG